MLAHAYTNETSNSAKIVKIQRKHRCILHRDRGHAEKATNWVSHRILGRDSTERGTQSVVPRGWG